MARKNSNEACMFCGESPCECDAPAPKKKPAAKKAAPKKEPTEAPRVVETAQPAPITPMQPAALASRKPLASSAAPIPTVPRFQQNEEKKEKTEADWELEKAVRLLNLYGLIAPSERRRHADLLYERRPTGKLRDRPNTVPEVDGLDATRRQT